MLVTQEIQFMKIKKGETYRAHKHMPTEVKYLFQLKRSWETATNSMVGFIKKMTKMEKWTKKCKCGAFISNRYDICDRCLLKSVELNALYEDGDEWNEHPLYPEEDVIKALRKIRRGIK
jgi:hypothetical protein